MNKEEAEDFVYKCLLDNESKDVKERLSRKHITDILSEDFEIPTSTAYRYYQDCLLYTSPSPRDGLLSRMPSSA